MAAKAALCMAGERLCATGQPMMPRILVEALITMICTCLNLPGLFPQERIIIMGERPVRS
jgi:hypothetical protein